jgi:hypothetical protein
MLDSKFGLFLSANSNMFLRAMILPCSYRRLDVRPKGEALSVVLENTLAR